MDTLKAFKDIEEKVFVDPTGKIHGLDYVANLLALSVGSGSQVLRSDQSGIWLGATRYANAPFRVNMAGSLFASSAEISGKITATSGSIGGFTIMADYLYAGAGGNTCGLSPADYPFWAGATYTNRATAPFRVTPAGLVYLTGKVTIASSDPKSNAILQWDGGSSIWEDSNKYLGLWAYGGQMYFWCSTDNDARLILTTGANQNAMYGGLHIYEVGGAGGNLNVKGNCRIRKEFYTDYDWIGFGDGSEGSGGNKMLTLRDFGITISDNGNYRQINFGGDTFLKIKKTKTLTVDNDVTIP
jgi:hypothetical protein